MSWDIRTGDVLDLLHDMPDESVQCVVTSPPYWGLRDYAVDGMIGLEPTLELHLGKLVEVFGEVRRVLRDDGTLWLNYGDAYAGSNKGGSGVSSTLNSATQIEAKNAGLAHKARKTKAETEANKKRAAERGYDVGAWGASDGAAEGFDRCAVDSDLAAKQRMLLPARVALALQASGWWVRSEIVWAKGVSFCPTYAGSCMPSSVQDRPTDSHEMLYLLTKKARYFYDADAVREASSPVPDGQKDQPTGRNLRTVWTINPQGFPGAHFATFPTALVRPCILAGTSERGACSECGAPWRRVVDVGESSWGARKASGHQRGSATESKSQQKQGSITDQAHRGAGGFGIPASRATTGWEPTCKHADAQTVPCVVLDPFSGSGTTGVVSRRLGRDYIGLEINADYVAMSEGRLRNALRPEARPIKVSPGQFDMFGGGE